MTGEETRFLPASLRGGPMLLHIDLTQSVKVSDFAFARGGSGGGGSGGGDTGTTTPTNSYGLYTSGPANAASGFNITIEFVGTWSDTLRSAFVSAANHLSSLIVGDVADYRGKNLPGGLRTIDDIYITAELTTIDGVGGVLGSAGPTALRSGGLLPALASMKFDVLDAQNYDRSGLFDDIVLHEMTHSLGVGSIWNFLGLTSNGLFIGANAVKAYQSLGGRLAGVPIETDGGAGTAGSHWDEATFGDELMTGYINSVNHFSAISVASLADLGYVLSPQWALLSDASYTTVA